MIEVCITTAPRELPTLNICVKCLREAGYENEITIFAEPEQLNVNDKNLTIFVNKTKLGAFNNYDNVLNWFLTKSEKSHILIMQDDLIACTGLFNVIGKIDLTKEFGYYNLLTVAEQPKLDFLASSGWSVGTRDFFGAWGACYLMSRETVKKVVEHEYYIKHKEANTNKTIDGCISQCMYLMKLPMYYHNPSLVQHIGVFSTLSHNGILTGYKFDKNYGL